MKEICKSFAQDDGSILWYADAIHSLFYLMMKMAPEVNYHQELPRVLKQYAEILDPNPPEDPKEREGYYACLAEQFPKPNTPDFAILAPLVTVEPSPFAGPWRDPELWRAYLRRARQSQVHALMQVFTPFCSALARRVEAGCIPKQVAEAERGSVYMKYDDSLVQYLPLIKCLMDAEKRQRLFTAMNECRGRTLGDIVLRDRDARLSGRPQENSPEKIVSELFYATKELHLDLESGERKTPVEVLEDLIDRLEMNSVYAHFRTVPIQDQALLLRVWESQRVNGYPIYKKNFPLPTRAFSGALLSPLPASVGQTYDERVAKEDDPDIKALKGGVWSDLPTPAIMVPVGPYGEGVARALLATTYLLIDRAALGYREFMQANEEVFSRELAITARKDAFLAIIEGLLSLKDVIVLLMSSLDDQDPVEAIRELIEADLVNHAARLIPPGYVAPLVLTGRYVPELVHRDEGGFLHLAPMIRAHAAEKRREYREKPIHHGGPASYEYYFGSVQSFARSSDTWGGYGDL